VQVAVVLANDLRVGALIGEEVVGHQDPVLRALLLGL
jgi:hypothetical protein